MSHRDGKAGVGRLDSTCLKVSLRWLLREVDWSDINLRTDCTWTPFLLTATALMWAWSSELTLVDRFEAACRIAVHLFCPKSRLAKSYQAFTKLLRRWTEPLIELLKKCLREQMQRELTDCWLILGFVVFAADGSRGELPRTRSHEEAYSHRRQRTPRKRRKSRKGRKPRIHRMEKSAAKKANSPQLWMTTMWHVGSGLPWDWRLGPADSSERAHLRDMLCTLPAGALITVDAGFVGYEYLRAIIESGRHVLLRVGSNVRLLKRLGYVRERGSTVYLWPDSEARKGQPPLVLRMVVAHNGKHPLYLVTSILSESRLTDTQVVELYARRWGIELFYRHLKQTFQRRKMRSTSAGNALPEMHWSYAGLWAMALYTSIEFRRHGLPIRRLSVAQMLRAFRQTMRDYLHPTERGKTLRERLRTALIDTYTRKNKASRDYPRKKQETPPGPPHIAPASAAQIRDAQELHRDANAKGLTA